MTYVDGCHGKDCFYTIGLGALSIQRVSIIVSAR